MCLCNCPMWVVNGMLMRIEQEIYMDDEAFYRRFCAIGDLDGSVS